MQELLEGETLRERLDEGALSTRKALDYALQIARGLAAAHARGVVHRDLKPANIFITRDGRGEDPRLRAGQAHAERDGEESDSDSTGLPTMTRGTTPGSVLGTVGYMSPEQVKGQAADPRSDIFAFGAVLYEMVTGQRAFKGDSAVETMSAIIKEEPPEISTTGKILPAGLERLMLPLPREAPRGPLPVERATWSSTSSRSPG